MASRVWPCNPNKPVGYVKIFKLRLKFIVVVRSAGFLLVIMHSCSDLLHGVGPSRLVIALLLMMFLFTRGFPDQSSVQVIKSKTGRPVIEDG